MATVKICVVGPEKSGKTLVCKLLSDQTVSPSPTYRPTVESGVRIQEHVMKPQPGSHRQKPRIQLWDCSGSATMRPLWQTLSKPVMFILTSSQVRLQGLDGVIFVYDTEQPGQQGELEKFYKGFAQPHKLTVAQCLLLGVNLSGGYSMGTGLKGPMASLKNAVVDIDPQNPEAASNVVKEALEKFFVKCLEKCAEKQNQEIEEEVLEDDGEE